MTPASPVHVYVGLGGNVGDVAQTLRQAVIDLGNLPNTHVLACSKYYRTPAWGLTDQPAFINASVLLTTELEPHTLLARLHAIERRHGRNRDQELRWGPRSLDLDILLYGNHVIDEGGLSVPHPRMHDRAFVLLPLAEVAPNLSLPGHGAIARLLAALDVSGIEVLP